MSTHFWTLAHEGDALVWDPDMEPAEHPTGYGHAFLELFVRMRGAGYSVTLGRAIPDESTVVVASLEELNGWHPYGQPPTTRALAAALLRRRRPLAVIRNDVYPHYYPPLCTSAEAKPTRAAVGDSTRDASMPLLPQRGLLPRDESRAPAIRNVGLKVFQANVPEWFDDVSTSLRDIGVELRLDTQVSSHGWHDFRDLDAVLCTQDMRTLGDARRKPATKLINAWCAGVVPIYQDLPGYAEIANDGVDSLRIAEPADILNVLVEANSLPGRVGQLLDAARGRAQDFSVPVVLAQWDEFFSGVTCPPSYVSIVQEWLISELQILTDIRVGRRLRRLCGQRDEA